MVRKQQIELKKTHKKGIESSENWAQCSAQKNQISTRAGGRGFGNDTDNDRWYNNSLSNSWKLGHRPAVSSRQPASNRFRLYEFSIYATDHKVESQSYLMAN